jgi:hypothetical protein
VLAAITLVLASAAAVSAEPDWADLAQPERRALAPLAGLWEGMAADERAEWRALAARMPQRSTAEQARLQQRMRDWAGMTPDQRGQARLQFQQAQRWSPEERRQRWQDYQSLHPQARSVLAERWRFEQPDAARAVARDDGAKRNLVEVGPAARPPRQAVGPTAVRAPSGATTQPLTRTPAPPPHHQHGLPKVVAGETFVDPATLLPRRGPQGAAVLAPPAAQPAPPAAAPAAPRRPAAPAR